MLLGLVTKHHAIGPCHKGSKVCQLITCIISKSVIDPNCKPKHQTKPNPSTDWPSNLCTPKWVSLFFPLGPVKYNGSIFWSWNGGPHCWDSSVVLILYMLFLMWSMATFSALQARGCADTAGCRVSRNRWGQVMVGDAKTQRVFEVRRGGNSCCASSTKTNERNAQLSSRWCTRWYSACIWVVHG